MADKPSTYKKVEIVGTSDTSLSEAIAHGVERAGSTLRHIGWFEVTELRGRVGDDGRVAEYQVGLKVGLKID